MRTSNTNPSPKKLAFARELRANPTVFEKRLRDRLKKGVKDIQFSDQVTVCGYVLDFYCDALKLAVELDGNSHNINSDKNRDCNLFAQRGISVMRYANPASEIEIKALLFEVWAECRWRLGRLERGFSTFPQRLSVQIHNSQSGNGDSGPFEEICEYVKKPGACYRQVFATALTAETTAIALRSLGIDASVERCPSCHLIHLKETRVVVPLPPKPAESPVWHKPFHYEVFDSVDALKKARR